MSTEVMDKDLWKAADAAYARGTQAYLDFSAALGAIYDQESATQEEIGERYNMVQSRVAEAIRVGKDRRVLEHKEDLPRSKRAIYLLTTLDDEGFKQWCKPSTLDKHIQEYKFRLNAPKLDAEAAEAKLRELQERVAQEQPDAVKDEDERRAKEASMPKAQPKAEAQPEAEIPPTAPFDGPEVSPDPPKMALINVEQILLQLAGRAVQNDAGRKMLLQALTRYYTTDMPENLDASTEAMIQLNRVRAVLKIGDDND